jgi:hypothetical protein
MGIATAAGASAGQLQRPAPKPLEVRVTLDYRSAVAVDVIRALAVAAGLSTEIGVIDLRPITITLTNVRLGTALNAVCDNAFCSWELQGNLLKVAALETPPNRLLPRVISMELSQSPLADVLTAFAVAIDVELVVQTELPQNPVDAKFTNAEPENILNFFCQLANCAWDLDSSRRLTIRARK